MSAFLLDHTLEGSPPYSVDCVCRVLALKIRDAYKTRRHPLPHIIGISGSVAVGKSMLAQQLKAQLTEMLEHTHIELVCTDNFLYPQSQLIADGMTHRKGFPESYDWQAFIQFVTQLKAGASTLSIPLYSHSAYDILPNQYQYLNHPDIVILEGINVLQRPEIRALLDHSLFIDAPLELLQRWYIDRFLALFVPSQYEDPAIAIKIATQRWIQINEPNLRNHILPSKPHAHWIIEKTQAHQIQKFMKI